MRTRRRLPPASKALFAAAAACAGAAAWLVVAGLQGPADAAVPPLRVVTAVHDLEAGAKISPDDVTVAPVAATVSPPGALTDVDGAVGVVAVTPFLEGEVVTRTRLASSAGPASRAVPPGLVGISLTPDAAPQGLGPGDRVDVLATFTTARPYTTAVAEDALVLRVAGAGGAFGGDAAPALTLVVDPVVARSVASADVTAHVSVVVRGYVPAA
jgi:Flp pilus assembly protein CpaB